jgi:hypothetical protein
VTKEPAGLTHIGDTLDERPEEAACGCGIVGCQAPQGLQAIGCILRERKDEDGKEERG